MFYVGRPFYSKNGSKNMLGVSYRVLKGCGLRVKIVAIFSKKSYKIFWKFRKMLYLCTRFQSNGEIAQLVRAHDS